MTETINVHTLPTRREWPAWYRRGKIKMVVEGTILPTTLAYAEETVEISPRFLKNGQTFRIRPVNPARYFAAWCHENHVLPTLFTPEECQQEDFLVILDTLWQRHKHQFEGLASPFAASDFATTPNHRVGFSYVIPQVLVQELDQVRPFGTPRNWTRSSPPAAGSLSEYVAMTHQVEALRRRNAAASGAPLTPLSPEKQKQVDELDAMLVSMEEGLGDDPFAEPPSMTEPLAPQEPVVPTEPPIIETSVPVTEPPVEKPLANGKKNRR